MSKIATASDGHKTPFDRFDALMRQVVSVPKTELDRRAEMDRKKRATKRADKKH